MMKTNLALLCALGVGAHFFTGCAADEGEETKTLPLTHEEAAEDASKNTEQVLGGVGDATSFLTESSSISEVLSLFASAESDSACPVAAEIDPETGEPVAGAPEPSCEVSDAADEVDLSEFQEELDTAVDELITTLQEEIFIASNIEEEDQDSVTYLLGPELLCGVSEGDSSGPVDDGSSAEPMSAGAPNSDGIDPECAAEVEDAEIRLRVTSPADGDLNVQLLLTDERINPISFELHQDRVGVSADLAQLQKALERMGEDLDGLRSMSGVLEGELIKNGERDVTLRLNVNQALKLEFETEDGEPMSVSLEKSAPTMELRINGADEELSATYDYGAFTLAGPLSLFADMFEDDEPVAVAPVDPLTGEPVAAEPVEPEPDPVYTGEVELFIGGYEASMTLDGSTDELRLTGLGLGDATSTLKHDGKRVLAIDLNPDDGRHFDMSMRPDDDGTTTMTFEPSLDLSLMFAFKHLADQLEVPEYLMDDTLRLWFDGDSPKIASGESGVQVLSGAMHLSSSAVPEADIDVDAGQCLLEAEASADEEPLPHELLSSLEAGSCE